MIMPIQIQAKRVIHLASF